MRSALDRAMSERKDAAVCAIFTPSFVSRPKICEGALKHEGAVFFREISNER